MRPKADPLIPATIITANEHARALAVETSPSATKFFACYAAAVRMAKALEEIASNQRDARRAL